VRLAEEKVGQEKIVAEKRAACRLDSELRGSGVGFEIETWTLSEWFLRDKARIYPPLSLILNFCVMVR